MEIGNALRFNSRFIDFHLLKINLFGRSREEIAELVGVDVGVLVGALVDVAVEGAGAEAISMTNCGA